MDKSPLKNVKFGGPKSSIIGLKRKLSCKIWSLQHQGTFTRIPRLKISKCGGHIIPKTAMDILLENLQRIRFNKN